MVKIVNFRLLILSVLLACGLATGASAAEWTVVKTFGETWVESTGIQKASLARGARLAGNATIVTGADGKVFLARGDESVVVAPNSVIRLQKDSQSGIRTTIRHDTGTATYLVHKRSSPHFTVQTPTLAALVKGTKFKVVENRYVSKVWVAEGLVQVSVPATGERADIKPGQSAVLERGPNASLRIVGVGVKEPILRSAALEIPGTVAGVGGTVNDTVGGVGGTVGGTVAGVTGTVSGVAGEIDANVSGVTSTIGGTVSGITSSLGGSLGGGLGGLR